VTALRFDGKETVMTTLRTLLMLSMALGVGRLAFADEPSGVKVTYENGKLSVSADKAPRPAVLAEIARASGSRISGLLEDSSPVTAQFANVSVDEALERVLGDQPFATRYRGDRLSMIHLVDRGKGGKPIVVYPTPARAPNVTNPPMIALSGRLASRVGSSQATLTRVAKEALGDEDATIRTEAAQAIVAASNRDAALQEELVATYGRMSDEALLSMVHAMPGATEFFEYVAAHTRSDELRDKADAILRALRQPAGAPAPDEG
jgi:hypothetical protein